MNISICPRKLFACGDVPMHWCMTCPKQATRPASPATYRPSREAEAAALLRRGLAQLTAWQEKYGKHGCQWVPPAGDVRWMEDVSAFLKEAPSPVVHSGVSATASDEGPRDSASSYKAQPNQSSTVISPLATMSSEASPPAAIRDAPAAPSEPTDMVMLPRVLTDAMVRAAEGVDNTFNRAIWEQVWDALIDAAKGGEAAPVAPTETKR